MADLIWKIVTGGDSQFFFPNDQVGYVAKLWGESADDDDWTVLRDFETTPKHSMVFMLNL